MRTGGPPSILTEINGMKKIIPFLILFLFLAGCGHGLLVKPPPAEEDFWKLHNEVGGDDYSVCLDKAQRYARILRSKGLEASVVIVDQGKDKELHAVVLLESGNWFDPTLAKSGDDIKQAGRFLMKM